MFKIRKASNGQYYFKLVGRNGETLFTSETYTRKDSCKKGIAAIKRFVNGAKVIDTTV